MPFTQAGRRTSLKKLAATALAPFAPPSLAFGAAMNTSDLVVFIPGIMGSVLRKNGRDVWALSSQGLLPALRTLGGSLDALRLQSDPLDVDVLDDGVTATRLFSDVHLIPGFWKIDGYDNVRSALSRTVPLKLGLNYFEFPYDWRRDNRVAARQLAQRAPGWLAKWRALSKNPDARLVLVAHSMGGIVARYFIECLEGWRLTRKLVTYGTPYRGSPNALDFLANGYQKSLLGATLADLSELLRSFTSVYQLLPRYPCVDLGNGVLQRPGEATGIPNIDHKKAADALAFHRQLDEAILKNATSKEYVAQQHQIHPVVGVGQATKQSARLHQGRLHVMTNINGHNADGDGTVPRPSAIPIGVDNKQEAQYEASALFVSGIHGSLQNLPEVSAQVSSILTTSDFEQYRKEPELITLEVDDAYVVGEPVHVRCRTQEQEHSAVVVVEEAHTRRAILTRPLLLSPTDYAVVRLPTLQAGTYRVLLQVNQRTKISDIFIVSQ